MKELWKDISGYEGQYKVSNKGLVMSIYRRIYKPKRNAYFLIGGKCLKPHKTPFGHLYVSLYRNGEFRRDTIHRLVYETFNGKIPVGLEIDHIDGNPANNNINNLRAITHRRNVSLGYKKRLLPTGVYKNGSGKYYAQITYKGQRICLGSYENVETASNIYQLKREEYERALL